MKASELKNIIDANRTQPITFAVVKKVCQLSQDRFRLSWNQPLQVVAQSMKQFRLIDNVGEGDHHKDEQGNDGEEGVVRNGPGQKDSLIGAKGPQGLDRESSKVLQERHVRQTSKV